MAKRKKKTKAGARSKPRARKPAARDTEQGALIQAIAPDEAQRTGAPRVLFFDGQGLTPKPHIYVGEWQLADWKWSVENDRKEAERIVAGVGEIPRTNWTAEARVRTARRALEYFTAASHYIEQGDADAAALQAYRAAVEVWRCRMQMVENEAMLGRHLLESRDLKAAERSKRLKARDHAIRRISLTHKLSAEQTRRKFESDHALRSAYPDVAALRRETIARIISGRQ